MRKFLVYFLTYIVMLMSGVGGVFLFTNQTAPSRAIQVSEPSAFDKVVSNLMQSKALTAGGEFVIKENEQLLANVALNVQMDLIDGFTTFNIAGSVNISRDEKSLAIDFAYIDGKIYVNLLGAKYQATTEDIEELVKVVGAALSGVLPEVDISSMLDINALMGLMQNVTEEKGETENNLKMNTPVGDIVIKTDLEYNIKSVNIPKLTFDNYTIEPKVALKTKQELLGLNKPSDESSYAEASKQFAVLTAVLNTVNTPFTAAIDVLGLESTLTYDKNNLLLQSTIADNDFRVAYYGSTVYANIGALGIKCDGNDISALKEFISGKFDFEQIEKQEIIGALVEKLKTIDFSKLTLEFLNKIVVDEDGGLSFEYNDIKLNVKTQNLKVASAKISYKGYSVACEFNYSNIAAIAEPTGKYLTISNVLDLANASVATFKSNNINAVAKFKINEQIIKANVNYAFNGGNIYLSLDTKVGENDFDFTFSNGVAYISYQGIKIKVSKQTIVDILTEFGIDTKLDNVDDVFDKLKNININDIDLTSIKQLFSIELTQDQKQTILAVLKTALDIISNTSIEMSNDILQVANGVFDANVELNGGKIGKLTANYNDYSIETTFEYKDFTQKIIAADDYVDATQIVRVAKNFVNYAKGGIFANFAVNYAGVGVTGYVNVINKNIAISAVATYDKYSANIVFVDNVVYVSALGANVKFAVADIDKVKDLLTTLNVTMPQMQDISVDYSTILGVINKLYLAYTGDNFSAIYENYEISLDIKNDNLVGAKFKQNAQEIFTINFVENNDAIEISNKNEYLDITQLFPVVEPVLNTIKATNFSGTAVVKVNANNQEIEANIDYKIVIADNNIRAYIKITMFDIAINVTYIDNVVYVQVGNLNISASINELDKVIDFIENNFGEIDAQMSSVSAENIVEILKTIANTLDVNDLSFVNTIAVKNNSLSIRIGKCSLTLNFADTIMGVELAINDLNIDEINLDNISVEVGISTNSIVITKPNCEFVDINDILNIVDCAIATAKSNAISGRIELQIMNGVIPVDGIDCKNLNLVIDYNYSYNGGNVKFDASTQILNDTLKVALVDGVVYLSYQDVNVRASLDSLSLPKTNTSANISFENIIDYIKLAISNISLGYDNNTLTIAGNDLLGLEGVSINVSTQNKLLSNILLSCDYATANITFNAVENYTDVTLEENYVDAKNLVDLVKDIVNVVSQKQVFANIDLKVGDYAISGLINYSDSGLQAQMTTKLFGKNVDVRLLENIVYVNFDGLKIKFNLDDTDKVINLVNKALNNNSSQNDVNIKIDEKLIKNYLNKVRLGYDGEKITIKVANFSLSDFGLNLDNINLNDFGIDLAKIVSGEIKVVADCENNTLNGASVSINDYASVVIKLNNSRCDIDTKTDGYFDIITFLPFVEPFIDGYLSGMFGTITVFVPQIEKYVGEIKIDYIINNNGVQLKTVLFGQNIMATLQNEVVYLEISGLKYKFGISEINDIIDLVFREFNIEKSDASQNDFNLDNISFGDITFASINDKNLQISYKGVIVQLSLESGFVASIEYDNMTFTFTQSVGAKTIQVQNKDDYLPLTSIIKKASSVYSIVESGKVAFDVDFSYDNISITGDVSVDFKDFMNTLNIDDLKVSATIKVFEKTINLNLRNGVIYADVDGMKLRVAFNDIDTIISWVEKELNIKIDTNTNVDLDINSLIKSITQNGLDEINVETNIINLKLTFNNNNIQSISCDYDKISAKIDISNNFKNDDINAEIYSNVVDILPVCSRILQVYRTKALSLDAEINAKLLGFDQTIIAGLNIDYNDKIKIDLTAEFKGLSVTIFVRGSTIYVNFADLKMQFVEKDLLKIVDFANRNFSANLIAPNESTVEGNMIVDFINKNFDLGFKLPYFGNISAGMNDLNLDKVIETIKGIDFATFGTFSLKENSFNMNIASGSINLDLANILNIVADFDSIKAKVEINATGNAVVMSQIDGKDYATVEELLNTIQCVIDTLNTQKYTVSASTQVYNGQTLRFDGNVNASLDIAQKLFHGDATLKGEQDIAVALDFDGTYFYVNYSGLKLKIHKTNIQEIAGIVLAVFGYDINSLGIFDKIDLGDLDFGNIKDAMPTLDFGDPFAMLKIVKSINYSNGAFEICLDGKAISGNENAETMTLNIGTKNGKLSHFDLNNFYTGVTSNEFFNLNIDFVDFKEIPAISGNYFDISSISDLLKGVINTSELNDYHITATLDVVMTIIGIDIDWNIPIDIKIKLVDRKPVIAFSIGEIPVIVGVNNIDSGIKIVSNRMAYVYYYDESVYVQVKEKHYSKDYEKRTKIHYTTFVNNIGYYLQYMTGFTDSIMSAINESIEKAKNRTTPINMGNVLLDYNNNNGNYNVKLNLKEISNDDKLDSIAISIMPSYVESAQKEYITDLTMQMVMPLANGVNMNLESNDMKLIDIGQSLNLDSVYAYANSYSFDEGAEWVYDNKDWECKKSVSYSMSFETNGGAAVADITGAPSSKLNLPTYSNRDVIDGNTKTTYRFDGWYTSATFDDGTEFTSDKMPRQNTKLYAKWTEINRVNKYTLTFETNGGDNVANINQYEGYSIELPNYEDRVVITDTEKTTYRFAGWYTSETFADDTKFENTEMPSESLTLYAKWDVISNYQKQTINFMDGDKVVRTISGFYGDEIVLSSLENKEISTETSYYEYEFDGWFKSTEYEIETLFESNFMPNESFDLYAKWNLIISKQTLTLFDGGKQVDKIMTNVGEEISLPKYEVQVIDDLSSHTRTTRTFIGWFTTPNFMDGTLFSATQMPENGTYLYANWNEKIETIYSLKIVNAGANIYDNAVISGTQIDMSSFENYKDSTLVYSSPNFEDSAIVDNFTVLNDSTWYLRNKFSVTIKSQYTSSLTSSYEETTEMYEGSSLTLPQYAMLSKDYGSYTSEYEFGGYKLGNNTITSSTTITPNGNCVYTAIWTETQWCTVIFDNTAWVQPSSWKIGTHDGYAFTNVTNTDGTNKIRIKRGEKLIYANFTATCKAKYGPEYKFKTVGWETQVKNRNTLSYDGGDGRIIDSNITLKPVWKAA